VRGSKVAGDVVTGSRSVTDLVGVPKRLFTLKSKIFVARPRTERPCSIRKESFAEIGWSWFVPISPKQGSKCHALGLAARLAGALQAGFDTRQRSNPPHVIQCAGRTFGPPRERVTLDVGTAVEHTANSLTAVDDIQAHKMERRSRGLQIHRHVV
jgi:hypothetical protein